jgi:hypothetical protein
MWNKLTGKSSESSSQSGRRRGESTSSRKRPESVVSSTSTRRPKDDDDRPRRSTSRTYTYPTAPESVASSYATAPSQRERGSEPSRDEKPKRRSTTDGDDPYFYENQQSWAKREDSPSGERGDKTPTRRERERSRSPDGEERRKERRERREKGERSERSEKSSRRRTSERGVPRSETGESTRAVDGERAPSSSARVGASTPSSGGVGSTSDPHVAHQFPGQDPATYAAPYRPALGAAAEFYNDQGESVMRQPGVRPVSPMVNGQPHLMSASAAPAPPQETGHGAADDYFGSAATAQVPSTPTKPSRPSSKPGSASRPSGSSSRPSGSTPKPSSSGKISSTAALAGGAALAYAAGHQSEHASNSSVHAQNGESTTSFYQQQQGAGGQGSSHGQSLSASNAGGYAGSNAISPGQSPRLTPMQSPSTPHKSHTAAYVAGAAGLAAGAYALHNHHSHQHSESVSNDVNMYGSASYGPGPSQYGPPNYNSPNGHNPAMMAHEHKHRGPVTKVVDWWKDYEDVRKMEEYTEYIGVCRDCFDPRSTVYDAPRKHQYRKRKSRESLKERKSGDLRNSSEYLASGRIEKDSRYYRESSDNERKRKSNKGSWIAAGLAGYGLAKAGKAIVGRNGDFDDTYSVKSGRRVGSRTSLDRSRSRSGDRHTSRGVIRRRSSSLDRKSRVAGSVAGSSFVDVVEGTEGSYRIERKRSKRTRSRSRSRDRTSAIIGASAAGAVAATALAAHERRKHRSRSNSPQKESLRVRRGSRRSSQESLSVYGQSDYRRQGSRRSTAGSSREDVSTGAGGVFGFFSNGNDKRRKTHAKKRRGFFTFGNSSSSSAEIGLAYGTDIRRDKRKPRLEKSSKRKSSDEKINATLLGIGATAAALAAAQHGRNKSKSDLIAVRERRDRRSNTRGALISRPSGASSDSVGSDDEGWEDAGDDSSSVESHSGLAYGDFDFKGKARKSTDSLVSNDSGTWKWGWRWGRKKKRQPSQENLGAGGSFVAPLAVGALGGMAAAGAADAMSTVSSQQSLQSVYPVPTSDPSRFDAIRRYDSTPSSQPQPLWTSRPENLPLQQPQPVAPVSDSVYTTQAQYSPAYVAPSGPPVDFSSSIAKPGPQPLERRSSDLDRPQATSTRKTRRSSSPPQSHIGRDAAIAGIAAAAAGAAAGVAISNSKSSKDVRFDLDAQKSDREQTRERKKREEEEALLREEEERARERRKREEARAEAARREEERRAEEEREISRRVRLAKDAEMKAQQEREVERLRREREDAAREAEAREAAAREAAAREEAYRAEQLRLDREERDRERDRKERERREAREIRENERRRRRDPDSVSQDTKENKEEAWVKPVVAGVAAAAAGAAIASYVSSHKDEENSRSKDAEPKRQTYAYDESTSKVREVQPSVMTAEPHVTEPKSVEVQPKIVAVAPRIADKVAVDTFDDEVVFDPDYFKKKKDRREAERQAELARTDSDKVIADLEERYSEAPVDVGNFWAPPELLNHSGTERHIDANSDADIHVYHAPDVGVRGPPYDRPYMFTATRDGQGSSGGWGVPTLNLIEATPPASQAASIRDGHSVPPSPEILPKDVTSESERTRSGSKVTWGEDQTFHYDAQTPDSFRDSYIGEHDMTKDAKKTTEPSQNHDEIVVEVEDPVAGLKRTTYKPELERSVPPTVEPTNSRDMAAVESPVEEIYATKPDLSSASPYEVETPIFESHSPAVQPVVFTPGEDQRRGNTIYQNPYFETVSDLGFDLSNNSGPTPRRPGFVEEDEVLTETPKADDFSRGMPGGFVEEPRNIPRGFVEEDSLPPTPHQEVQSNDSTMPQFKANSSRRIEPETPASYPVDPSTTRDEPIFEESSRTSKKKSKRREVERDPRDLESSPSIPAVAAGAAAAGLAAAGAIEYARSKEATKSPERQSRKSEEGITPHVNVFDFMEKTPGTFEPSISQTRQTDRDPTESFASQTRDTNRDLFEPPNSETGRADRDTYEPTSSHARQSERDIVDPDLAASTVSEREYPYVPRDPYKPNGHGSQNGSRSAEDSGYISRYQSVPDISETNAAPELSDDNDKADDYDDSRRSSKKSHSKSRFDDDLESSIVSSVGATSARTSKSENYYDDDTKSKRRHSSRRDDDPEPLKRSSSYPASEPGDLESSRKSKRRSSKRDSDIPDDVSIASTSRSEDRKSKEKKGGLFGGLFSNSSKSDVSSKSRAREEEEEDRERRRKKKSSSSSSRRAESDDERRKKSSTSSRRAESDEERREKRHSSKSSSGEKRRSRSNKDDSTIGYKHDDDHPYSRYSSQPPEELVEDVISNNGDNEPRSKSRSSKRDRDESFLGDRAEDESARAAPLPASSFGEIPSLPDLPYSRSTSPAVMDKAMDVPSLPASRPITPTEVERAYELPELPSLPASRPTSPLPISSTRDLPSLPTTRPSSPIDVGSIDDLPGLPPTRPGSPYEEVVPKTPPRQSLESLRAASTTAIPLALRFGRHPSSPGLSRDLTFGAPSVATLSSPLPFSPLNPPKIRHQKSHSSEINKEYRPLYLLESNRKTAEVEESLPPLPDSAQTSRTPSAHESDVDLESAVKSSKAGFHESPDRPIEFQRNIFDGPSYHEPDHYLDSQETTPKAATFPENVMDTPRHEMDVNERRSPSPFDDTPIKPREAHSRQASPRTSSPIGMKGVAVAAGLGGLAGLAAHELLSSREKGYDSDFMAGEPDEEHSAPKPVEPDVPQVSVREESTPVRPTLSRSSSSKKGKKSKRGSRELGSVDLSSEPAAELTAEELQQIRERDAAFAVDSWFGDAPPVVDDRKGRKGKGRSSARGSVDIAPVEEKEMEFPSVTETVPPTDHETEQGDFQTRDMSSSTDLAESGSVPPSPNPLLLARAPKGKGKKKTKRGSKSGSISFPSEAPPTPLDEALDEATQPRDLSESATSFFPEQKSVDKPEPVLEEPTPAHEPTRELKPTPLPPLIRAASEAVYSLPTDAYGYDPDMRSFGLETPETQPPIPLTEPIKSAENFAPSREVLEATAIALPGSPKQEYREIETPFHDEPLTRNFEYSKEPDTYMPAEIALPVSPPLEPTHYDISAADLAHTAYPTAKHQTLELMPDASLVVDEQTKSHEQMEPMPAELLVNEEQIAPGFFPESRNISESQTEVDVPAKANREDELAEQLPGQPIVPGERFAPEAVLETRDIPKLQLETNEPAEVNPDDEFSFTTKKSKKDKKKAKKSKAPSSESPNFMENGKDVLPLPVNTEFSRDLDTEPVVPAGEPAFEPVATGTKKKGKKNKKPDLWADDIPEEPPASNGGAKEALPLPIDTSDVALPSKDPPSLIAMTGPSNNSVVDTEFPLESSRELPSEPVAEEFEPVSSGKKRKDKKKKKADIWADEVPQESVLAPEEPNVSLPLPIDTIEPTPTPSERIELAAETSRELEPDVVEDDAREKRIAATEEAKASLTLPIDTVEPNPTPSEHTELAQETSRELEPEVIAEDEFEPVSSGKKRKDKKKKVKSETWTEEIPGNSTTALEEAREPFPLSVDTSEPISTLVEHTGPELETSRELEPESIDDDEFQPTSAGKKKKDKKKRKSVSFALGQSSDESAREAPSLLSAEPTPVEAEPEAFVTPKKVKGKGKKRQQKVDLWAEPDPELEPESSIQQSETERELQHVDMEPSTVALPEYEDEASELAETGQVHQAAPISPEIEPSTIALPEFEDEADELTEFQYPAEPEPVSRETGSASANVRPPNNGPVKFVLPAQLPGQSREIEPTAVDLSEYEGETSQPSTVNELEIPAASHQLEQRSQHSIPAYSDPASVPLLVYEQDEDLVEQREVAIPALPTPAELEQQPLTPIPFEGYSEPEFGTPSTENLETGVVPSSSDIVDKGKDISNEALPREVEPVTLHTEVSPRDIKLPTTVDEDLVAPLIAPHVPIGSTVEEKLQEHDFAATTSRNFSNKGPGELNVLQQLSPRLVPLPKDSASGHGEDFDMLEAKGQFNLPPILPEEPPEETSAARQSNPLFSSEQEDAPHTIALPHDEDLDLQDLNTPAKSIKRNVVAAAVDTSEPWTAPQHQHGAASEMPDLVEQLPILTEDGPLSEEQHNEPVFSQMEEPRELHSKEIQRKSNDIAADDGWAPVPKKSKKDKKKGKKSALATPTNELEPQSTPELTAMDMTQTNAMADDTRGLDPTEQLAEPPIETAADDEWASTTKKSKKDKKKGRKSALTTPPSELEPKMLSEFTLPTDDSQTKTAAEGSRDLEMSEQPAETPVGVAADNEWVPTTKKSKKDKKKARNSAMVTPPIQEEPLSRSDLPASEELETQPDQSRDLDLNEPPVQDDITALEQPEALPSELRSVDLDEQPSSDQAVALEDHFIKSANEPFAKEPFLLDSVEQMGIDEAQVRELPEPGVEKFAASEPATRVDHEPSRVPSILPAENNNPVVQDDLEDEWALPSKQKSKKGKKARQGSVSGTPPVIDDLEPVTTRELEQEQLVEPTGAESVAPAENDELWGPVTKKSKKKGKKEKKASMPSIPPVMEETPFLTREVSNNPDEAEPTTEQEISTSSKREDRPAKDDYVLSQEESRATEEPGLDSEQEPTSLPEIPHDVNHIRGLEEDSALLSETSRNFKGGEVGPASEIDYSDQQTLSREQPDNEEWDVPSKKKGKRGKKAMPIELPSTPPVISEARELVESNQHAFDHSSESTLPAHHQDTLLDATESVEQSRSIQSEPAEDQAPQQADEEFTWAPTKKKGKGKKAKKSGTQTPISGVQTTKEEELPTIPVQSDLHDIEADSFGLPDARRASTSTAADVVNILRSGDTEEHEFQNSIAEDRESAAAPEMTTSLPEELVHLRGSPKALEPEVNKADVVTAAIFHSNAADQFILTPKDMGPEDKSQLPDPSTEASFDNTLPSDLAAPEHAPMDMIDEHHEDILPQEQPPPGEGQSIQNLPRMNDSLPPTSEERDFALETSEPIITEEFPPEDDEWAVPVKKSKKDKRKAKKGKSTPIEEEDGTEILPAKRTSSEATFEEPQASKTLETLSREPVVTAVPEILVAETRDLAMGEPGAENDPQEEFSFTTKSKKDKKKPKKGRSITYDDEKSAPTSTNLPSDVETKDFVLPEPMQESSLASTQDFALTESRGSDLITAEHLHTTTREPTHAAAAEILARDNFDEDTLPNPSEEIDPEEEFGFPIKKKKDKKKGKQARLADVEDSLPNAVGDSASIAFPERSLGPAEGPSRDVDDTVHAESPMEVDPDDEFTFTTKKKKDKKKKGKSGVAEAAVATGAAAAVAAFGVSKALDHHKKEHAIEEDDKRADRFLEGKPNSQVEPESLASMRTEMPHDTDSPASRSATHQEEEFRHDKSIESGQEPVEEEPDYFTIKKGKKDKKKSKKNNGASVSSTSTPRGLSPLRYMQEPEPSTLQAITPSPTVEPASIALPADELDDFEPPLAEPPLHHHNRLPEYFTPETAREATETGVSSAGHPFATAQTSDELQESHSAFIESSVPREATAMVEPSRMAVPQAAESPPPGVDFAATIAAGLQDSGFDPNMVIGDPEFHRPPSRSRALEEPDYDELPLQASRRSSRRGSRRQSRSTSVDATAQRDSDPKLDHPSEGRPPPTDDKEFAAVLAAGLQGSGFDPDIVREDVAYSQKRSLSPSEKLEDEPEGFSMLHQRPRKGRKGKRELTSTPPSESVDQRELSANIPDVSTLPGNDTLEHDNLSRENVPPEHVSTEFPVQPYEQATQNFETSDTKTGGDEEQDEWGFPVTKKSKKSKKGTKISSKYASGVSTPAETVEPREILEEEGADAVTAKDLPQSADAWEVPTKKKAGKKGKRSGKSTPLVMEPDVEAPAAMNEALRETSREMDVDNLHEPPQSIDEQGGLPRENEEEREEEWTKPSKKNSKKDKKTKRLSTGDALMVAGAAVGIGAAASASEIGKDNEGPSVGGHQEQEILTARPTTPISAKARNRSIDEFDDPSPEQLQQSPSSAVGTVFPNLERVKRKAPARILSSEHTPKRVSTGDGEAAHERLVTPISPPQEPQHDNLSAIPESHDMEKPRSIQDLTAPTWGFSSNRDSAIEQESPVIPSSPPIVHDMTRDSGYHDTPAIPFAPVTPDTGSSPPSNFSHPRSGSHSSGKKPIKVQVEVEPHWDVSLSQDTPSKEHRRTNTADTNESLPGLAHEHEGYPFPVSQRALSPTVVESTSKDRGSALLFQSSPSSRDGPGFQPSSSQTRSHPPPEYHQEESSRELPMDDAPKEKSRHHHHEEIHSRSKSLSTGDSHSPALKNTPVTSTPATHVRNESVGLDTILETSPASPESPLARKGRMLSDFGKPEREPKHARRSATPERLRLVTPQHEGSLAPHQRSTPRVASPSSLSDEVLARRSWPAVDEDNETVGIDQVVRGDPSKRRVQSAEHHRTPSRSRDIRKVSPMGDLRSPSVMSDKSNVSFNRIRSPDNARPLSPNISRPMSSASVRSDRSLRRVDRSASGDLRSASKRQEANVGAKLSDAAPLLLAGAGAVALASTIHDNDKGIARSPNMEGVFVSQFLHLTIHDHFV